MAVKLRVLVICCLLSLFVAASSTIGDGQETLDYGSSADAVQHHSAPRPHENEATLPDSDKKTDHVSKTTTSKKNSSKASRTFLWDYPDYGHDMGYRSDFYWLIPLVMVIGMGALLLPICSALMTALVSSGAITLTAGRRKRDTDSFSLSEQMFSSLKQSVPSATILALLTQIDSALDKFAPDMGAEKAA